MEKEKTYEDLIKQEAYKQLANLLFTDSKCKKNNWYCIKRYYHEICHVTIDRAVGDKNYLQPSTVERMIRTLKQKNHILRTKKDEDDYKQIALDVPAVKVEML